VRALQQPLRGGARPCFGDDAAAVQAMGCQGALQAAGRLARVPGEGGHGVGGGGVLQHLSGQVLCQRIEMGPVCAWASMGADKAPAATAAPLSRLRRRGVLLSVKGVSCY